MSGPNVLKSVRPDEWPETIHAEKAVLRFPNGVESGNWQSREDNDTREYIRADLHQSALRAEREKALREAVEAARSAWRNANPGDEMRGVALAEAAILALIDGEKP